MLVELVFECLQHARHDSAFHAIHGDSIVGGDPNSRLGYGPSGTLVNGGFFFGKVRAWGSDESKVFGGARTACPAGTVEACTLARRVQRRQALLVGRKHVGWRSHGSDAADPSL